MKMKQAVLMISVLMTMGLVRAQGDAPYMSKTFSNVNKLRSATAGGNISVEGTDGSAAKVEVYIRGNNSKQLSKEEIQERLASYELVVEQQGNEVVARAKNLRNNWKDALSISFKITMPRKSASHLRTSGGNIALRNLDGNQDFATSGGNLVVADLKGVIKGTTSGGNITAQRVNDDVDLTTSGGNVSAESSTGKLNFSTSGGNVNLRDLNGNIAATTSGGTVKGEHLRGEINATTSGGNVVMEHISGSLDAGTSGGNVRVVMDQVDKFVKLSNSGGSIDIDLPEGKGYNLDLRGDRIHTSNLRNFSGKMSEDKMNGTLNGGGSLVTAVNSGKINISFH